MFAFIFDSVGFGEWFVLLAVVLVVVGPKNLPELMRKFGRQYAKFRRHAEEFKRQLLEMDNEIDRMAREAEREAQGAFTIEGDEASATPAEEAASSWQSPS